MSENETTAIITLKDFISDSLTQIVEGIADAQERTKNAIGTKINPLVLTDEKLPVEGIAMHRGRAGIETASLLHFDIAVTVSREKGLTGEGKVGLKGIIGVLSGSASLSAEGHIDTAKSQESRIRFTVPVLLPRPPK